MGGVGGVKENHGINQIEFIRGQARRCSRYSGHTIQSNSDSDSGFRACFQLLLPKDRTNPDTELAVHSECIIGGVLGREESGWSLPTSPLYPAGRGPGVCDNKGPGTEAGPAILPPPLPQPNKMGGYMASPKVHQATGSVARKGARGSGVGSIRDPLSL